MNKITVKKWATEVINLTIKKSGVVFNLTGYTIHFYVKDDPDSTSLSIETTWEIISAAAWTAKVTLTSTQTNLTAKMHHYEVRLISGESKFPVQDDKGNYIFEFQVKDSLKIPS